MFVIYDFLPLRKSHWLFPDMLCLLIYPMSLFFKIPSLHINVRLPVWKLPRPCPELFISINITLPVFQISRTKEFSSRSCALQFGNFILVLVFGLMQYSLGNFFCVYHFCFSVTSSRDPSILDTSFDEFFLWSRTVA